MQTRLALLAALLGTGACIPDDSTSPDAPEPQDTQLHFGELSTAARARLVRGVLQDSSVAKFIAREIQSRPACAVVTVDQPSNTVTFTGSDCDTGTGSTFHGVLTQLRNSNGFDGYHFENVQITGELPDDALTIQGDIDFEVDLASQRVTEHIDLEVTRGGLTVHTKMSSDNRGSGIILSDATVELDGRTAEISGTLANVVFVGADRYTFVPAGDCGTGTITAGAPSSESVCLWSPTPSRFTRGAIRQLTMECANGDGKVRLETTSGVTVRGSIGSINYEIGSPSDFDSSTSTFVFEASDSSCAAARSYSLSQNAGIHGSHRAELMSLPRVTWGTEE